MDFLLEQRKLIRLTIAIPEVPTSGDYVQVSSDLTGWVGPGAFPLGSTNAQCGTKEAKVRLLSKQSFRRVATLTTNDEYFFLPSPQSFPQMGEEVIGKFIFITVNN